MVTQPALRISYPSGDSTTMTVRPGGERAPPVGAPQGGGLGRPAGMNGAVDAGGGVRGAAGVVVTLL